MTLTDFIQAYTTFNRKIDSALNNIHEQKIKEIDEKAVVELFVGNLANKRKLSVANTNMDDTIYIRNNSAKSKTSE